MGNSNKSNVQKTLYHGIEYMLFVSFFGSNEGSLVVAGQHDK